VIEQKLANFRSLRPK